MVKMKGKIVLLIIGIWFVVVAILSLIPSISDILMEIIFGAIDETKRGLIQFIGLILGIIGAILIIGYVVLLILGKRKK